MAAPAPATDALAFAVVRVATVAFRDVDAPNIARPHELPFANGPPSRV